jgi:hypothetical protein
VWTVLIEVALIGAEHGTGRLLVVDQHPVGALRPDASNEPDGLYDALHGYAVYMNEASQTVNPLTRRTTSDWSDPFAYIPLPR